MLLRIAHRNGEESAQVQADVEEEVLFSHAEFFEQQQMSRRGHGQKFARPLHKAEQHGFEYVHFSSLPPVGNVTRFLY